MHVISSIIRDFDESLSYKPILWLVKTLCLSTDQSKAQKGLHFPYIICARFNSDLIFWMDADIYIR